MDIKQDGSSKTFNHYMRFSKLFLSSSYFLVIIYIVFFARRRRQLSERQMNIVPFRNIISTFQKLGPNDRPGMIDFYTNLWGNIIMFIPLSMIMVSVFRICHKKTVISCLLLFSVLIEVTQWIFKIGVADIDDVILNTCGAIIGLLFHTWLQKYVCRQVTYKVT